MSFSFPPDLMVSVSGFRGRVSEAMTPDLVTRIAASYGSFLRAEGDFGPVVVGRDSRTSGPALERAVVAGLLSAPSASCAGNPPTIAEETNRNQQETLICLIIRLPTPLDWQRNGYRFACSRGIGRKSGSSFHFTFFFPSCVP